VTALLTLAEYVRLTPYTQGFFQYMQGGWPESELKDQGNPYELGTAEHREWERGQFAGVLEAQDSEE
jgi:hypothetical protein